MKKLIGILVVILMTAFLFAIPAFHSVTTDIAGVSETVTATFSDLNTLVYGNTKQFQLDELWVTVDPVLSLTSTSDGTFTADTKANYSVLTIPDNDDLIGTLLAKVTTEASPAWTLYWNGEVVATNVEEIAYSGITVAYTTGTPKNNDEISWVFGIQSTTNDFIISYTFGDVVILYKADQDRIVPGDLTCGFRIPYTSNYPVFTITNSETVYRCKYHLLIQTYE